MKVFFYSFLILLFSSQILSAQNVTKAYFAGGCFWCTEAVFINLKGVNNVVSGYIGGDITNPTYEIVCSGKSGYLEAIKIDFDPSIISYTTLLEIFFI